MAKLNENEKKALDAIISTCDDLDGDLFTRLSDAITALMQEFNTNGHVAGGYIITLMNKGYIDLEPDDIYGVGLWVNQ